MQGDAEDPCFQPTKVDLAAESLPSLRLAFKLQPAGPGQAKVKEYAFTSVPIGLTFDVGVAPIVVKRFTRDSAARRLGMRCGMVLTAINGKDVSNMPFAGVFDMLQSGLRLLPSSPSSATPLRAQPHSRSRCGAPAPGARQWRELQGGAAAPKPVRTEEAATTLGCQAGHQGSTYGSVGMVAGSTHQWFWRATHWLATSAQTDPGNFLDVCDMRPRKLKAPVVLGWILLQVLGMIFQATLLLEVSRNLAGFEAALATNCSPRHQLRGVCLGPTWNLSFSGVFEFPASQSTGAQGQSDFDFVIPSEPPSLEQAFQFGIASQPPSFLLGIEPQPPHEQAIWDVRLVQQGGFGGPPQHGRGTKYKAFTGRSGGGGSPWRGTLSLRSRFPEPSRILLYVVDSRIRHLEGAHEQSQCSFEKSWENFSERHNGKHHKVLTFAWHATAFFLGASVFFVALVSHRFYFHVESAKLLRRSIALKFVVQDLPQQLCIAIYIYGWYASNGLRCQMCLFHPAHCDAQHPLHLTNSMVCLFTMLSASASQLLFQAKGRFYDEEELCVQISIRGLLLSVSTLPFNTALLFLSASLLHLRSVAFFFLVGVPTLVGWMTLVSSACLPLLLLCDQEI